MRLLILFIIGIVVVASIMFMRLPHEKTSIGTVVMPGQLAQAHVKYENDCTKCHSAFRKEKQDSLCLFCHEDVAADLKGHEGFHGRMDPVEGKGCKSCHSEHRGRNFDMIHLDKETFNHRFTDYPLTGVHASADVTCRDCHLEGKKFREAMNGCFDCHAEDDHHKGQLGTDCISCHRETSWKETFFDHKKTRFVLEGKHREITCGACHSNEIYKNTPASCIACHLINDVHKSPSQERCDRCHNSVSWKVVQFDHNKETKFLLENKHDGLKCDLCHVSNLFKDKSGPQCIDCHKADDVHKGKSGIQCDKCHSTAGWERSTFDHDRDTRFKLTGPHGKLQCVSCHKSEAQTMKIGMTCGECHQADDVHKGQEGIRCESCHNETGWRSNVRFDHDLSGFPLVGIHAVTPCSECHVSLAFKDADIQCATCHNVDDFHKKALGSECSACHNPNGWKLWEFDHDLQTKFKLVGAHAGLECKSCHYQPMEKRVESSSQCVACHDNDDVHKGRFGERCEQCHTQDSFEDITIIGR